MSSTPRNRSISVRLLAPTLAILHLLGKKLNILSFALASDARDSHTPVSDQGECPPPPPALLTQDSMPRERRHLAGVTWEGGLVVLSFLLSRECSLDATGLLRFRTGDVLLGTSGVGVCGEFPRFYVFIIFGYIIGR